MEALNADILRMFERIVIALGGILSIFLGYRLFMIATPDVRPTSGGSFKSALFTMSLSKVGPGVFFALFGAYILVTGISKQIEDDTETTQTAPAQRALVGVLSDTVDRMEDGATKENLKTIVQQMQESDVEIETTHTTRHHARRRPRPSQ
jgi:hypothetical protein